MAAPSLDALLDFEGQIERAAQTILVESGVAAFITGGDEMLPLGHTGISCDVGAALPDLTILSAGRQEYFKYPAALSLEVSVARDGGQAPALGVDTFLGQCRGRIRGVFLRVLFPFNDTNLPYLRVTDVRPNGTTTGYSQVRNLDVVVLGFALSFAIKPGAWPVGFPPAPGS